MYICRMNTVRRAIFILYACVIAAMGAATIVEKFHGTEYVKANIYGAWWFTLLWAVLAAMAIFYFLKRRVRVFSAIALHLSFLFILLGALLTHTTSRQGVVHLRQGEPTDVYYTQADNAEGMEEHRLPFSLKLDKFNIMYHDGTTAVADYETRFTLTAGEERSQGLVSMNNIFSYRGYRLYQSSYDRDGRGSILSMNNDPWGIPVTYTGYALLFVSLVWMLIDPKGSFRKSLRHPLLRKGALTLVAMLSMGQGAAAAPVLPRETAEKFGRLNILYNDRICPLQTFAIDFTKKIYGKASYNGLTAEQVVTGFIFHGDEWSAEPVVRLKDGDMKAALQLPDYTSVKTFFNPTMGGYIIGPYVREYYLGAHDKFHKQVAETDDKIQLIMDLRRGALLKVFPYTVDGATTWYAPTDDIPDAVGEGCRKYMKNVFSLLYADVLAGDVDRVGETLDKMIRYQEKYGGTSMPTPAQVKAERAYNAVPFATILFMVNLMMGFITLFLAIFRLTRDDAQPWRGTTAYRLSLAVMSFSFAALTVCEVLRWVVSGKIPMGNGYETMLFVAWLVMLASLIVCRRFRIVLTFGFLMSGFFLLVSHIGQMDPNIGRLMPVLNSPLLSIHVSVIMTAFALLSLTFVSGLTAIVVRIANRRGRRLSEQLESLQLLSRLFLYPALTFLGIGIFVGAIWANVSWGNYWGWDPKEVWALITFMVYAVAAHATSIPAMRNPLTYHVFMVLAFTTILMTYFGVNYFLGGMHSYA